MKNILICLEQLGIGGIETFSISQINEFTRNNYKCYILAKKGILYDKVKDNPNVEFIEFEYTLDNYIDYEKVEYLLKKIKNIKFEFAIIHQFPCILYILPVAYKLKIPYVAYHHSVIPDTYKWFMDTYPIFKAIFPIYFRNANKIIAITDDAKKEICELFDISKDKCDVVNNCIDFNEISDYNSQEINIPFTNFLLVSRLSSEKRKSILSAISFFKKYKQQYNENARLTVLGNGEIFDEISSQNKSSDIIFKGAVSDVFSEMSKSDVVLGVDRCILEAISLKRAAVICGYDGNTSFVTPENISDAAKVNFSGKKLKDNSNEIFSCNIKKIKSIVSKNYEFAFKNLNIDIEIFKKMPESNTEFYIDFEKMYTYLNNYCYQIKELTKEVANYYNDGQRLYSIIDKKNNEINELNKKIDSLNCRTIKGFLKRGYRKFFRK